MMNLSTLKFHVLKLLLCCSFLLYNIGTNAQPVFSFDIEACIGDTVRAPIIVEPNCPFGPLPEEASPTGDNYIVKILDYVPEMIFIVLGEGSFSYQIPPGSTGPNNFVCPTDIYTYNITLKDDCEVVVPDYTICNGEQILIEGPTSLNGPQGPSGTVPCNSVTSISISPNDGIISQTPYGFVVAPDITTTYTITSTAGPVGPGDNCLSNSVTSEFIVGISNCEIETLNYYMCANDELERAIGDLVTYVITEQPSNGTIYEGENTSGISGGSIFYVPNTNYEGSDQFTIEYTNLATNFTTTSTFDVQINDCGDPVLFADQLCQADTFAISNGDGPPPEVLVEPSNGILDFPSGIPYYSGGGTEYVPNPGFIGTDYFTIEYTALGGIDKSIINFEITVIDCTIEEPCIIADPLSESFIQDIIAANNCADACGSVDKITAFTYNGNTYFKLDNLGDGPDCPIIGNTNQSSFLDCNGNFVCDIFGFANLCSNDFLDTAITGTTIWENNNNCGATVPELTEYDWLNNSLNVDDCCNNESAIKFIWEDVVLIYIKTATECGSLGVLFNENGVVFCVDEENYDCLDGFGLNESEGTILWACGNEPTNPDPNPEPCVTIDIFVLNDIIAENNCADKCGSIDQITGFLYEGSSYFALFNLNDGPDCPEATNGIVFLDCNGDFLCNTSNPGTGNDICSDDLIANANAAEIVWSNSNTCEPAPPTEPGNTEYDWLNNLLDTNDCCANETVLEFDVGSYSFIYVKSAANCGGSGKLYLNTGQLYCTDANNFDCLGAYGLNEGAGTTIWNCGDGPTDPTDPPNPTDPNTGYDWLDNQLTNSNCCNANAAVEFDLGGGYSFIYIAADADCGGFGTLYLNTGQLYCEDASNFDCLAAYGLSINQGTVLWNCEDGGPTEPTDPTEPVNFEDYPWLNNIVDANDCCINESVLVFPQGSYSFVYVKAGANCGGLGTLYLNTGQLYCTDASNFDCLGAYGLNESDGIAIWTCGTDDKPADDSDDTINDGLTEQSSRLVNTNSLSNLDNQSVKMTIYPNPSNGLVNISLNTAYEGDQAIRVFDLSGRTINEIRFTDAQNQVFQTDLTDLPDGLYLIEYSNANISNVEKVMIRR